MNLLQQLRGETREHHNRIEALVDVMRADLTLDEYRRLVTGFYGFYAPLEERLTARHGRGLLEERRLKTPWLEADVRSLGLSPEHLRRCGRLPDVGSLERASGCLYVLEGATLGGAVITPHLRRTLGLTPERGCAFFHSYGSQVGPMWQQFRRALGTFADRRHVVDGARQTFDCLHDWLGAELGRRS